MKKCLFYLKKFQYWFKETILKKQLSHNELIDILAYTFRFGEESIILPYLSDDFVFRSEFIFGYPENKEKSLKWLREYLERDKGCKMLKTASPYTGATWLRFSENPRSCVLGMQCEKGKITFVALCSQICDKP